MQTKYVADSETTPVVATNDLSLAMKAAEARADEVYKSGNKTLIDFVSPETWATWDASGENPLAADRDELGAFDPLDEDTIAA